MDELNEKQDVNTEGADADSQSAPVSNYKELIMEKTEKLAGKAVTFCKKVTGNYEKQDVNTEGADADSQSASVSDYKELIVEKAKKLAGKAATLCKKVIGNYRDFKHLTRKSQILHVAVPAICLCLIFSVAACSGNIGNKANYAEAYAALATESALPDGAQSAVRMGI